MSMPSPSSRQSLAELLVSAASELAIATASAAGWAPLGVPVRRGRLTLGRAARELMGVPDGGVVSVVAGARTVCWLGPASASPPSFGPLAYRGRTRVDARGRAVLDRHVRVWLDVPNTSEFAVVVIAAPRGGLLLVPVDGFDERWEGVRTDERLAG